MRALDLRAPVFICLALAGLLTAVYFKGLSGEFAFDDFNSIVGNTVLRAGSEGHNTWWDAARSGAAGPLGRPLSMLSFAFNYRLFGEAAFSFKLTNLLIHYANALLVIVLVRQILLLLYPAVDKRRTTFIATSVSVIWVMHPINALPVLYVVQRMTSLSGFFMLAGLCLYLAGRQKPSRLGFAAIAISLLLCGPAAVFCKETGALFGVYLLLCEWLVLRSFKRVPVKLLYCCATLCAGALLMAAWWKWDLLLTGYHVRNFDLPERLLTEARVLWFYVQQILMPIPREFGLYLDDFVVSTGLLTPPTTLLAVMGWVGFVCVAWVQRGVWPGFAFAVFWFLGSHLLESTVVALELAFEHRNYLASVGLFMWLVHAAANRNHFGQPNGMLNALVAVFAAYCGFVTSLRAAQWSDDLTRRQVEVYNHPRSARAHYEMAIAVQERTFGSGQGSSEAYQTIESHLRAASELDPHGKVAPLGLLYLNCLAGKPRDPAQLAELRQRFATQKFSHQDRHSVHALSGLLVENKLCLSRDEVFALLDAGLSNPQSDDVLKGSLYAVGMDYAAAALNDGHLALQFAQAAVAIAPNELAFSSNLIHLLLQSDQLEAAKSEYSRVSTMPIAARNPGAMAQLKALIESAPNHVANPR